MIEKPPETKTNTKKPEHLKEGVSPIIACVGTPEDFKYDGKINWLLSGKEISYAHNVNYARTGHTAGHVMSPLDGLDKYSREFYNCTGLIISGTENATGKNISLLSHQNPEYFLNEDNRKSYLKFSQYLTEAIKMIKARCAEGTIDAVVFGGSYAKVKNFVEPDPKRDLFVEEYLKSIEFLSSYVKDILGFEPLVIVGPKIEPGGDMVFYDNDTKKLYLVRKKIRTTHDSDGEKRDFTAAQSFTPSEMEETRKNWKPGEWGLPI